MGPMTQVRKWSLGMLVLLAMPAGAATVAELEKLPPAQRQTRAHQAALAAAYEAEKKPGPAGEAVGTYDLLPADAAPDVDAVRKWLKAQALEQYKAALAARAKGDRAGAVRAYVHAILLDPGLQARDDQGIRALAESSLDGAVVKKPTDAALRFKHALLQYHFGNLSAASTSFAEYLKIEKDPYFAWRGGLWQAKVKGELAAMAKQDEKNKQDSAARRVKEAAEDAAAQGRLAKERADAAAAKPSADPSPAPGGALSPEGEARKKTLQDELDKLDVAIAAASNIEMVKEAAGAKYGKLVDQYANNATAQGKIKALKDRRAELQNEMGALK